jgi:cytochrome P450
MIARWVALNDQVGVGALVPNERFTEGYEQLLSFADELEAEVLGMIRRRRESREQGRDVLSILVRSNDEEGGLSDEELVGQAAVLFGAAHMTTAHSLTWTLLLLAQHPSIMRQLWLELNDPNRSEGAPQPKASGSLPKGEDLSLLDRVIKESMRVLPASAYSQRINTEAVQLGPLELPRGTGIIFTPIVTHHLADLYPQPEKFIPDRWHTLRPSPYAYHPFGAGPRLCIGAPLATAVIRIALQRILSTFRLSAVPGSDVSAHIESTMLFPTHGLPMEIHPADGNFASSPIMGNIHDLVDFDEVSDFAVHDVAANGNAELHSPAPRRPR